MTHATAAAFETQLATYRNLLEPAIAALCLHLEQRAQSEFGDYSRHTVQAYTSILDRGGKRLRGSLVLAAYQMCGGKNIETVMPVAVAVEMLQAYLLILDDIYDYSATRRGGPTAHVMMRDLHAANGWRGDSLHFGEANAGLSALVGSHTAMEEIAKAPLDDHAKVIILRLINQAMVVTGYGQVNDVFSEAVRDVSEETVRNMLTWKTAYYTFISPLQIGAVAAGAREESLDCLREYGVHMGLAFQVADDILGTFGDESKSGKSTKDDLREGKITLLVSRALAKAAPEQRDLLLHHLGRHDLTDEQYQECKDIIRNSGALEYARELAEDHSQQAIAALTAADPSWHPESLAFLRELALYVLRRKG